MLKVDTYIIGTVCVQMLLFYKMRIKITKHHGSIFIWCNYNVTNDNKRICIIVYWWRDLKGSICISLSIVLYVCGILYF